MVKVLRQQYVLLQGSREVMLNFIDTHVGERLNKPVDAFEGRTIRYLLVHTANTHFHWLSNFALGNQVALPDDQSFTNISLIRQLYAEVDETVKTFHDKFSEQLDLPINNTISRNRRVSATPLELFTHVLTHEFHHKGQIMTMCRLLGHIPPDTDMIRF
jgi:uncharacterized damage-inducible protein DinB